MFSLSGDTSCAQANHRGGEQDPRQPTESTGLVGFSWLNRVGRPTAAARQIPQAGSWLPAPCRLAAVVSLGSK